MNKTYLKDDLVSFKDFINKEESQTLIDYFNHAGEYWSPICFYNSDGMAIVPNQKVLEGYDKIDISFLSSIQDKLKNALEEGLNTKVKANAESKKSGFTHTKIKSLAEKMMEAKKNK